jgi:signal transduction histidine kinase
LAEDLYRHNQDLQQFTYLVSHNLRAPLANAMGLTQLLLVQGQEQETLLNHIKTSLHQLDAVLRDMNTILTVRDKDGGTEQAEQVVLATVLSQVVQDLQEPLQQAGGQIVHNLVGDLYAHGNRAYLYSIFSNLLSNSIKYRSQHRPLKVTISGSPHPERGTLLTFSDNGSGFDQEKAGADIFKLYKRFHSAPAGRGMGLYLIKAHIESMGGHVEVRSQVEVGTQFSVYLP